MDNLSELLLAVTAVEEANDPGQEAGLPASEAESNLGQEAGLPASEAESNLGQEAGLPASEAESDQLSVTAPNSPIIRPSLNRAPSVTPHPKAPDDEDDPKAPDDEDDCPICLGKVQLPYQLTCNHLFCYLCIKRYASYNRPECPLCRGEIDPKIFVKKNTVTRELPIRTNWVYAARRGDFWYYDQETSDRLDELYKAFQENDTGDDTGDDTEDDANDDRDPPTITILGNDYLIDFDRMVQVSRRDRAKRQIKRTCDLEEGQRVRGVAGLVPAHHSQSSR